MRLQGKTALITGGNSGIGLATARLFIAEGAKVAITGRDRDTLNAAAVELGDNLLAIEIDVTDVAAVDRAVADTVKKLGKLDIVFANAGISGVTPIGQTDLPPFEFIGVNLTAVFFTVQAAAPHLTDRASIILNGSVHAVMGVPGWAAYAATKGAVRAMTRGFGLRVRPRGNSGQPGDARRCANPIWSPLAPNADAFSGLEGELVSTIPLAASENPKRSPTPCCSSLRKILRTSPLPKS